MLKIKRPNNSAVRTSTSFADSIVHPRGRERFLKHFKIIDENISAAKFTLFTKCHRGCKHSFVARCVMNRRPTATPPVSQRPKADNSEHQPTPTDTMLPQTDNFHKENSKKLLIAQ